MTIKILTVDPSINIAGWALWHRENDLMWGEKRPPEKVGDVRSKGKDHWEKSLDMAKKFEKLMSPSKLDMRAGDTIAIEWPQFMESEKGRTAARTGSLVKLTYAVGLIAGVCIQRSIKVMQVPLGVTGWNGQLPKKLQNARVNKAMGRTYANDHICDAVGIGLYLKGWMPNPNKGWAGFPDLTAH